MTAFHTQRSSACHSLSDDKWADGIRSVATEAAGLLEVALIDAAYGRELSERRFRGDPEATSLLMAVAATARRVKEAPRRDPAMCICCPRRIRRITCENTFGLAFPSVENPTTAVGFIFCSKCAAEPESLQTRATEGLRRIWPNLRAVTVTHPAGGRA